MLTQSRLVFDRAVLEDAMRIDIVGGHLSCDGARFLGTTTVRLRFTAVTLDGAAFSMPSIIAFAEDAFREQHRSQEVEIFDETPLQSVGLEARPRLFSLRGVDTSNLSLSGVDLRACRFADAYHLDQLRIQGARPFTETPRGWRLGRVGGQGLPLWRWTKRQTLAEEHRWHAELPLPNSPHGRPHPKRAGWYPSYCQVPTWVESASQQLGSQKPTPDRVALLYRALRKGREDAKDEPGAADFYYGEMEMRRHAASHGSVERLLLTMYWLVSGYALRAWRAFAALLLVVVLAAVIFATVGFASSASPRFVPVKVSDSGTLLYAEQQVQRPSFWQEFPGALSYSAETATSVLRGADRRVTSIGQWTQSVLRWVGPVLFGLALLSLRGRVKR
jgi:hypothetical protein